MSGKAPFGSVAAGTTTVLTAEARDLYLRVVRAGGQHPQSAADPVEAAALAELVGLGLLVPDTTEAGHLIAVDPTQLAAGLANTWQRQALDLLSRTISLPTEFHDLFQAYHSPADLGGSIEYVRGKVLINQKIQQYVDSGMKEALALQPGGPRPPELLDATFERDLSSLSRGTTMRTIYHASTRYHQPTRDYVAKLTKAGGQYRTLDEPYGRLIVLDRRLAVIPVGDDMGLAAFIHEPAIAAYLTDAVFEPSWNRALTFDGDRSVPQQVVSRLRQTIIELLLAGTNHRVIARRLGISERTLARHIAEMREDYNVDSLFQLGYVLAQASAASQLPGE
ncbi:helix-turn-helix domain-containing protein [Kitasatospora sp. NPDC059673]|uniref:helix-turn-helix domain-containing protein n=1 Tax=Kitasatospora sp. NPDC059673 TaxID=3346901 RepID=UPI003683F9D2